MGVKLTPKKVFFWTSVQIFDKSIVYKMPSFYAHSTGKGRIVDVLFITQKSNDASIDTVSK